VEGDGCPARRGRWKRRRAARVVHAARKDPAAGPATGSPLAPRSAGASSLAAQPGPMSKLHVPMVRPSEPNTEALPSTVRKGPSDKSVR